MSRAICGQSETDKRGGPPTEVTQALAACLCAAHRVTCQQPANRNMKKPETLTYEVCVIFSETFLVPTITFVPQ